ncbi:MAG: two-component system sensor histidine kinase NtrB [Thermodesulfobacteriota bacterium]
MTLEKIRTLFTSRATTDYHLKNQLHWVLFLRVVIITSLLGLTLLLQGKEHDIVLPSITSIIWFLVVTYLFTIISALLLKIIPCAQRFAYVQIIIDCGLTTCIVFFTGGSESIFTVFYFLPIISSAMILFRRGALLLAALSTCSYGAILLLEYLNHVDPLLRSGASPVTSIRVAMHFFAIRGVSFFLVALLSSFLSERLYRAEAELSRASRDLDRLALLYKQIFDDIATGIITVDSHGRISSFNRSAGVITGYGAMEVLGKSFDRIFPELTTEKTDSLRPMTSLQKKGGEKIPVGYSWTRLNMPGDCTNCRVYTMQDLSVIKKMEEQVRQSEKMAAIGEMAAGIAHEFRNPLAAISGAAQVLEGEFAPGTASKSLMTIIVRECDRLEGTISEFLQFSKPAVPEKNWISLPGIVEETIDLLRQGKEWDERFQVAVHIPEHLECWGDARQIKQIFLNLMGNARNAMGENGGVITIAAEEIVENGLEKTEIRIQDSGPGIDPKHRNLIFEPFFTTRENGTGLGLAIVRQLVESHGGEIRVDDNDDTSQTGACFLLTLPLP